MDQSISDAGVAAANAASLVDRASAEEANTEILRDIEHAIANDEILRRIDLPALRVQVSDGSVILTGNIATRPHAEQIEAIVRAVHGVGDVANRLVADDDLEIAVAQALGKDQRTRSGFYRVTSSHGTVRISTQSLQERSFGAAEDVASAVPGVRVVAVVEPDSREESTAFLPPMGTPVYASDGKLGDVTGVVTSRHTRQVTQLVVAAQFRRDAALNLYGDAPSDDHTLVVPVGFITQATRSGIFLGLDLAGCTGLPEFKKEDFSRPGPTWQPSIDYRAEDVYYSAGALAN